MTIDRSNTPYPLHPPFDGKCTLGEHPCVMLGNEANRFGVGNIPLRLIPRLLSCSGYGDYRGKKVYSSTSCGV
ncbi:hypothetical protein CEXT_799881 [Caerostris extrusa]|uniref:Uncharacterized protein n=1 Tax=Caerostris extrusa TaxID=172846 RepID=A0AAV4QC20_CAEEX|nr:hypothetical protein CEXT_799881 [Caerostris extrusa]